VDIYATAIHHGARVDEISDLDLSYTPPLGSPWDAVQITARAWDPGRHWRAGIGAVRPPCGVKGCNTVVSPGLPGRAALPAPWRERRHPRTKESP
jgi:hypothetical protein